MGYKATRAGVAAGGRERVGEGEARVWRALLLARTELLPLQGC